MNYSGPRLHRHHREPKYPPTQIWLRLVAAGTCLIFASGCATYPSGASPEDIAAIRNLRQGRSANLSAEERAEHYLEAAELTAPRLGPGTQPTPARETYNAAATELTILLRSADGGRLWNQPLTLTSGNETYHLRLQPADRATWSPNYFSSFVSAASVKKNLKKDIARAGVGAALVGVRSVTPREPFAGPAGITAPVTATLDFNKDETRLALRRPDKQPTTVVKGITQPLAADFSAPLGYYRPPGNLLLVGVMAALRSGNYMNTTGLYFLEPYDPDRIPVVFVHGLISTAFTWVQTINGLQADPEIRKHYQFWVFNYPTGNPILYSALRFREELARADQLYPNHKPYVLVGHSMGGILSRAQVTTVTRPMWEKEIGSTATSLFARNSPSSLIGRAMVFQPNPRIKRVVFVCTPHRGSELASGGIGRFAISLITLPLTLTKAVADSVTQQSLQKITGTNRLPNSVSGLKPGNPSLKVINASAINATYNSIIGDRGKGDSPNSTDGVVPYWSSHVSGAQSECIVPGPHASCELPQTIAEIHRILLLHLRSS